MYIKITDTFVHNVKWGKTMNHHYRTWKSLNIGTLTLYIVQVFHFTSGLTYKDNNVPVFT